MNPIRHFIATAHPFIATSCLLAALASAGGADTRVGGDVEIDVETGSVVTLAAASDAKAVSNIGSILDGTRIGEDVEIDVKTGDVTSLALGSNSRACANIGSVGARHDCE